MCSFTVLGGPGTSQYLVWPPFASCSATHLLHIELIRLLIVACGMLVHSSSMAVWSCWILAGTGTRCRIRRSRASQTCSMGDMSGEYAGHARTGMVSASRNCVQMRWWSWMNGTTMGLRISSCYLCAFKMTSIKYTCVRCPNHNPTATMGHSIHNIDISKPLTHTTPYTLSAICPVQWKQGFICEENTSPKCQTPSNVSIWPLKSVTTTNCSQVETPMRTLSMQMSFPETFKEILWFCKPIVAAAVRGAVSDDLGGEDAGCGGPGLMWLHVVCGCEAGWMYCQIIWNTFGDGLW